MAAETLRHVGNAKTASSPSLANAIAIMRQNPSQVSRDFIQQLLRDAGSLYRGMSDLTYLATLFLKRSYLDEVSVLPRMQDIPLDAFVLNPSAPVFVSHRWEAGRRPKTETVMAIRERIPLDDKVGVWIDYCCLPQRADAERDDRTDMEKAYFRSQLEYIPTIILKSQTFVLWTAEDANRAWCVVELLIGDIFRELIMKQIYHCRNKLVAPVVFMTQTYDPTTFMVTAGVTGTPVAKLCVPHTVRQLPTHFYNSLLRQLGLPPMLLTGLLAKAGRSEIDVFFAENGLTCTEDRDVETLKTLLLRVCQFAGTYDVTAIKWSGKLRSDDLLPYIWANMADFTASLVDYGHL